MLFPTRRRGHRHAAVPRALAAGAAAALVLSACAADEPDEGEPAATELDDVEPLQVVATTSILGDIVDEILGEQGEVTVLMGPGVDPHGYEPSARDGATMREADIVVANGLQLEESLIDTLAAVEEDGIEVFELAPKLDPIDFDFDFDGDHGHAHGDEGDDHGHEDDDHGHAHDDDGHDDDHGHGHDDEGHEDDDHGHAHDDDHGHGHDDEGHEDDDHGHEDDDHGHAHGPEDPHVWFDPVRMSEGVELLSEALIAAGDDLDVDAIEERTASYIDEIEAVHEELEAAFAETEDIDERVAVTNHDALGYLAHRYDFEVVGTVIPGASTQAETDARQFADLLETVERFGITTVFAENTDSTVLAEQLASEVVDRGDLEVEVVRIATDALDEPGSEADTYLGLLRSTGLAVAESFG